MSENGASAAIAAAIGSIGGVVGFRCQPRVGRDMDRTVKWPDFLSDLSDAGREFIAFWQAAKGESELLDRSAFDPMRMPRLLPGIQLVDVRVDGRPVESDDVADGRVEFVYRVVGTSEVGLRDHDPTGGRVENGFFGGSAARVRTNYLAVFRTRRPLADFERVVTHTGYLVQDISVFVPLGAPGGPVTQVLVFSEQTPVGEWAPSEGRTGGGSGNGPDTAL